MSFYAFCIFYLFVVDKGVSLAPTYSSIVIRKSDLRSSFKRGESSDSFYLEGGHLRRWTLKWSILLGEKAKALDL